MITEVVNGEARQVFDFSKSDAPAPAKFYAPVRIGAGYRRRIEAATSGIRSIDPKWIDMATNMLKGKVKPRGMSDKDWQEQMHMELQELILSNVNAEDFSQSADEDLIKLETLLTPAEGSLSVKTWYDEYSEESEVAQVINFSLGLVESKTETAPLQTTSGKATKRKAKAAA